MTKATTDKTIDKIAVIEKFRCRNCKHLHTLVEWDWEDAPKFFDICDTKPSRLSPITNIPGCSCVQLSPLDNLEYLKDKYNKKNG